MKIPKKQAIALFQELGFPGAGRWTIEKLEKKLETISQYAEAELVVEEYQELLENLVMKRGEGEKFTVVEGEVEPEPDEKEPEPEEPEPEEPEPEEEEEITEESVKKMGKKDLVDLVEELELEIDFQDYPTTAMFRKAIIEVLFEEEPEEEAEEEEEDFEEEVPEDKPKPKPKPSPKKKPVKQLEPQPGDVPGLPASRSGSMAHSINELLIEGEGWVSEEHIQKALPNYTLDQIRGHLAYLKTQPQDSEKKCVEKRTVREWRLAQ